MRTLTLALFALAAAGLAAPEAQAYDGCGGYGYGYGIGGVYRSLDYPTERRVPYFAAHPPVYYSQPVPRTYGHSPFAYPPHFRTPEIEAPAVKPLQISNPYVTGDSEAKPESKQLIRHQSTTAPTPLVIVNPYVSSSASLVSTEL
ncbi:hypothetical protein Mal64_00860 [Pseudobythopirellula maris]|uniref:Uncharacterized protein n=1 Tax=Pseudobythopirellula maris TaxID=2527991 RepID=A0A5C5ZRZ9_9BACT|nr:hypothetical protein [Pseudobythopirellula maris]TWT89707.1 hypothetical protein Mal64_00860 [Pseudobythopirellula maris]